MIKRIIRYTIISSFSILLVNYFLHFADSDMLLATLIKAAALLSLFEIFIKPILKFLLLPINILTLGLFRFFLNIPAFFLIVKILPQFKINDIYTSPITLLNYSIPKSTYQGLAAIIFTAVAYSLVFYLLKSILIKK